MGVLKPASRPIAKAIPTRDGKAWHGQFAVPGMVPDLVCFDGDVVTFYDEHEAEHAALRAMFEAWTSRIVDTRKAGPYSRMTPSEFSAALVEADVTLTNFMEIWGGPQARGIKWLDGEADIPHSAAVLVRLLAIGDNYEIARRLTDEAREEADHD